ncbi:MAG: hypothetical protein O3A00_25325 [Planctomycetota bacterium]|nr:hypothetical protein [Planctomycetota bacterium]
MERGIKAPAMPNDQGDKGASRVHRLLLPVLQRETAERNFIQDIVVPDVIALPARQKAKQEQAAVDRLKPGKQSPEVLAAMQ